MKLPTAAIFESGNPPRVSHANILLLRLHAGRVVVPFRLINEINKIFLWPAVTFHYSIYASDSSLSAFSMCRFFVALHFLND